MTATPTVQIGDRTFTVLPQTNKLDRALQPIRREQRKLARRRRLLIELSAAVDNRTDDVAELMTAAGIANGTTVDDILDQADDALAGITSCTTRIVAASFRDSEGAPPTEEFLDEHLDWRRFDEIAKVLGWDDDEDTDAADPTTASTSS